MKKMLLIMVMILLFVFGTCSAEGNQRFIVLENNTIGIWSFDSDSVKFGRDDLNKISPYIIDVWIKCQYSDESRSKNLNHPEIAYSFNHMKFDMSNRKMFSVSLLFYNESGKVISSLGNLDEGWKEIIPESFYELLSTKTGKWILDNTETVKNRSYK